MLGKHGNGAVDEIDRSGAFLGFLVYDGLGLHVVGHVGYMHSHFVIAVGEYTD